MLASTKVKLQLACAVATGTYANTTSTAANSRDDLTGTIWKRVEALWQSMPEALRREIELDDSTERDSYGSD